MMQIWQDVNEFWADYWLLAAIALVFIVLRYGRREEGWQDKVARERGWLPGRARADGPGAAGGADFVGSMDVSGGDIGGSGD